MVTPRRILQIEVSGLKTDDETDTVLLDAIRAITPVLDKWNLNIRLESGDSHRRTFATDHKPRTPRTPRQIAEASGGVHPSVVTDHDVTTFGGHQAYS